MAIDEEKTVEQLNDEADIAADYLEGLLDIADYEGDIEMGVRNGRPTVQIVADDDEDIKNLIGHNGEVVDALQLLTRLAVQQKTGERSRLILDVDGYLRKRRERLRDIALDVIDEVRETGEQVDLKPMNSFERKVVHDLVREEGLRSRSHGEEPHRYVSVFLKAHTADSALDDEDIAEADFGDPIVEDTKRRRAPRAGRDVDLDEVVDIDGTNEDQD
jgi:spoIIIJ-associated protein